MAWLENAARDVRRGFHILLRSRRFALAATVTVALGIGATTLLFAALYGAVIHPFPFQDAGRIAQLGFVGRQGVRGLMSVDAQDLALVRRSSTVEDAMLAGYADPITTAGGYPEDVAAARFSGNAFSFLGVAPLYGRVLTPADADRHVVVLSYGFCRRYFACTGAVAGRMLALDGQPYRIVGVMPARFFWQSAELYLPLKSADAAQTYPVFVKMRRGVAPAAVAAEMLVLVRRLVLAEEQVALPLELRLEMIPLGAVNGRVRQQRLELLFSAVCVLLLIAVVNVSTLFLARSLSRRQEYVTRVALGATRLRLLQQSLAEAFAAALPGGVLGVVLARLGIALLRAPLVSGFFPAGGQLRLPGAALAFSVAATLLAGAVSGVSPALGGLVTRRAALRGRSASAHRVAHALIASQVACALVLLPLAGGAARALVRVSTMRLGFDQRGVLIFRLPAASGGSWAQRAAYQARLRTRLQQLPGVLEASVDETSPLAGMPMEYGQPEEHYGADMDARLPRADMRLVDTQELAALRLRLLAGTGLTSAEYADAEPVLLISQSFARRLFGGREAVGRSLLLPGLAAGYAQVERPAHAGRVARIVGVVENAPNLQNPALAPPDVIYVPQTLFETGGSLYGMLRTAVSPLSLAGAARRAVQQVAPGQPVTEMRTLAQAVDDELRSADQWLTLMFMAMSGVALGLVAVGLYSVIAFTVAERSRELGLRLALGAGRAAILQLVLAGELRVVAAGLALGVAASYAAASIVRSMTGIETTNAWLLAGSCALMMLAAAAAGYLPARRGAWVDPMVSLREG